jgi:manganese-dependent inorganic pyrophosphatase
MPNEIAGLVMSGIISDTLFFKSPTTTIKDKNYAHEIAGKIGINIEKYAFEMFRAGTSIEGMTQEEIFYSDYKEFEHKSVKFGISQVFTLDIDKIIEDEESTLELLKKKTKEKEIDVIISVFTDILKEGSYVIGYSEIKGILKSAFKIGEDNKGVFLEGVVSRKKQIVPKIMDGIEVISI